MSVPNKKYSALGLPSFWISLKRNTDFAATKNPMACSCPNNLTKNG